MEACSGAHRWARELIALGHQVRLLNPKTPKPTLNAARTTAMTPRRSVKRRGTHFVPVKSVTQQAQGMVFKVRETLIGQS
jgi:transposase